MERRAITVRGIVQGVGFRPFVYGLAIRHGLPGFVKNRAGEVQIEVQGAGPALDRFLTDLKACAPPLSRIENLEWQSRPLRQTTAFLIAESSSEAAAGVFVSPDIATCPDCLAELFDRHDRRYGYPFLNCTNCGPRLTIVRGAPYDRCRTTMESFAMCPACRAEYEDPHDRRFHAQPIACPACGPRLEAVARSGEAMAAADFVALFADFVRDGKIGALKGIGGYHLVCNAADDKAVCELRRRKRREEMPLAIMVESCAAARRLCFVSADEQALLESPRRPIVLLRRLAASGAVSGGVAPGNPYLGVMLPYTPLHHLVARALDGLPLVMTSGNATHELIAYEDGDALARLGPIADIILRHNRPIHVRCDDSVTRIVGGCELPIRRSRGYAPLPIGLPVECPLPMLAVGGQLKGAFSLGREKHAILSHHLGDLDHFEARRQFVRDVSLFEQVFQVPELIVHDQHPDYVSTGYACERAGRDGLPRLAVQHHHAHAASCMAENGLDEPAIGVTFDGTGFGRDEITGEATIWGGEFLVADYSGFRRAAHLRNVPLPGGDQAIREPWRMAAAYLLDAGCDAGLLQGRISASALQTVETMFVRRFNAPLTSSAGRLFDAVAALAGIRDRTSYEGQAAMELEWAATDVRPAGEYPFELHAVEAGVRPLKKGTGTSRPGEHLGDSDPGARGLGASPLFQGPAGSTELVVDTRPIIRAVADDVRRGIDAGTIARRLHSTVVSLIVATCIRIREDCGLDAVVLSGGAFLNALLTSESALRLSQAGFRVYRHRLVPPNDAGLCLGQIAVGAAVWSRQNGRSFGALAERDATNQPDLIHPG